MAALGEELVQFLVDICLEFGFLGKSQFLHPGLTLGTCLPAVARTLVTSDMYDFGREHITQFAQNLLQERQYVGIACTQHVRADTPLAPYAVRAAGASQLRIDAECCNHVSRQVDFRNDVDVAFCCIFDYASYFLLRVIALLGGVVIDAAVLADDGIGTELSFLCQFGHALYLEAPALVVGQMPVELVQSVHGHYVNVCVYELGRYEVACDIQMCSAILEAWGAFYYCAWQGYLGSLFQGDGFQECLLTVEDSCITGSVNGDSLGVHDDTVSLGIVVLEVDDSLRLVGCFPQKLFPALVHLDALWQGNYLVVNPGNAADCQCGCSHKRK